MLVVEDSPPAFARVRVEYHERNDEEYGIATVEMNWKPLVDRHTLKDPYLTKSKVARVPKEMIDGILEDAYVSRHASSDDPAGYTKSRLRIDRDGKTSEILLPETYDVVRLARHAWQTGHDANRAEADDPSADPRAANRITRLPPVR